MQRNADYVKRLKEKHGAVFFFFFKELLVTLLSTNINSAILVSFLSWKFMNV